MPTLVEATDYDNVDPGIYDAMVVSVTRGDTGQYGPFIQFEFEVIGPDGTPVLVSGRSSDKYGPTCKGRRWIEAITGQRMVRGAPVDLDTLAGRPCRVQLDVVTKEKGTFNRVLDVLPPHKGSASNPKPVAGVPPPHQGGVSNPEPVTAEPVMDAEEQAAFAEFLRSRKAAAQHSDGAAA